MAKHVLGKRMFIGIKNPGSDNEWFDVAHSPADLAELDEIVTAGEYRLVRKLKISTEAKTTILATRKKRVG